MRLLLSMSLAVVLVACHSDPPEVERFIGVWGPQTPHLRYSYEIKSGGRYVLHGDTGSTEGTWKLVDSNADRTIIETRVGDAVDHIQLRYQDENSVFWTSLNTNDGSVFIRR